jgi:Lamin Tail Domain
VILKSNFISHPVTVLLLLAVPGGYAAERSTSQIVLNELQIAPSGGESEFIELFNDGAEPIDLSDITVSDSRDLSGVVSSGLLKLQPGSFLVLVPDSLKFTSNAGSVSIGEIRPWPSLNNSGDRIVLRLSGTVVDSVSYTSDWYERGRSLERIDPGVPGFLESNWAPAESAVVATPGAVNSVFARDLSPPVLQSASYRTPVLIDIFMSEPIAPSSFAGATISVDGVRVHGITAPSDLSVLTIESLPSGITVQIVGLRDYAGNEISPSSASIAGLAEMGDILISEIMFDPGSMATGAVAPEFIELYNESDTDIAISGLSIEVYSSISGSVRIYSLGRREKTLRRRGFAILYNETISAWMADPEDRSGLTLAYPGVETVAVTTLLPAGGSSLGLPGSGALIRLANTTSGVVIDSVRYSPAWHDTRWKSTRGRSISRLEKCRYRQQALCWTTTLETGGASPGALFQERDISLPEQELSVVVSEIMYSPIARDDDSRPDQTEFLEIVNTGTDPLDLNGLYVLLQEPERDEPDSIRLVHRPTILESGAYAAVFNLPGHVPDGDFESRAFLESGFANPDTPEEARHIAGTLVPTRRTLGLSSDGELIRLYLPGRLLLDELYYRPSWHDPVVVSGAGSSLERIDLSSSSSAPENWTTSRAPGGASPGAENSVNLSLSIDTETQGWQVIPSTFSPDNDGVDDRMKITLPGMAPSFTSTVTVYDLAGRSVKVLRPDPATQDAILYLWDGTDDTGRPLPTGFYVLLGNDPTGIHGRIPTLKKAVGLIR